MSVKTFALLAGLALSATGIRSHPVQDEIEWLDNYADAIREAKRTNKPIFLEFRCEA